METKKIYYGYDLLKFIMAIMIVALHANLLGEYKNIWTASTVLYSSAVPTFFAISIFVYAKKLFAAQTTPQAWSVCKKDVIRLLILWFFWFIVDIPMTYDKFWSIATLKEIFIGSLLVCPVRGLYFIQALIINKIIIFLFRNHLKSLSAVALIVYLIFSLGYTPLLNYFSEIFHPYYNFYWSLFFCCIGAMFAKYQFPQKLRLDVLALLLAVIFISTWFAYDYGVMLWRIVVIFFLMNAFMRMKEPRESIKPEYLKMRQMSIIIYFLHFNLLWLYDKFLSFGVFNFSVVRFVIVLIITLLIAYSFLLLENKRPFNFLKYSH